MKKRKRIDPYPREGESQALSLSLSLSLSLASGTDNYRRLKAEKCRKTGLKMPENRPQNGPKRGGRRRLKSGEFRESFIANSHP